MRISYYDLKLEEINLRMHQVRRLKELRLASGVFNTEALMLILNKKHRTTDGKRMLLKYLDAQDDQEIMDRKEKTLAFLNGSDYKGLDELVIPEYLVKVDGSNAGFAMPLIENHKNLGAILHSDRVSFKTKIELLKKLGILLDKVSRVESKNKLCFADLNEYNFILDQEDRLMAIDLDSSYIEGLEGVEHQTIAYYLLKNHNLIPVTDKYHLNNDSIIPSQDTDLYSYCMIILSVLAGESIHKKDLGYYYQYLDYLKKLGIPKELINIFFHVYTAKQNRNPYQYLDEIPDKIIRRSKLKVFEEKQVTIKMY